MCVCGGCGGATFKGKNLLPAGLRSLNSFPVSGNF